MLVRCFCPKHGRLALDQIIIRNKFPTCAKCGEGLEFVEARPRKLKK